MKTITEFCEIFGITRQTLRNWINDGKVKTIKIGRSVRIMDKEIARLKNGDEETNNKWEKMVEEIKKIIDETKDSDNW